MRAFVLTIFQQAASLRASPHPICIASPRPAQIVSSHPIGGAEPSHRSAAHARQIRLLHVHRTPEDCDRADKPALPPFRRLPAPDPPPHTCPRRPRPPLPRSWFAPIRSRMPPKLVGGRPPVRSLQSTARIRAAAAAAAGALPVPVSLCALLPNFSGHHWIPIGLACSGSLAAV